MASAAIDMNLYSRQLAVFGEAMGKLVKMDVLIIGLRGLGVETAKNIILAGPHSVTLYDPAIVTAADVGVNYYLRPEDVGVRTRAECVCAHARELNPYVDTRVWTGATPLRPEDLTHFHVVVVTSAPRSASLAWNAFCHAHTPPIAFIDAAVLGAAGRVFVDAGPAHVVWDPNGEATRSAIVTEITRSNPATVYTHDSKRHGFSEGDFVALREVDGMHEIMSGGPYKVLSAKPFSFTLDVDSSSWGEYTGGGTAEQVKVRRTLAFRTMQECVTKPVASAHFSDALITPDFGKFGRSEQLHIAMHAVELYRERHGHLPALRDASAAAETVALAKEWLASVPADDKFADTVDEDVVKTVALLSTTELPALTAFFGGIVAQEIVKITGKFTPIRQWLYVDVFEVLPPGALELPEAEWRPSGSRYDDLVGIFGRTFQAKISSQRVFVVGAGALGCEFLKDFAMMGVGCGASGRITVTDMDRIEVSNLNRQFLFRANNVGHPKSVTAAAAARVMNPELKIEALETPVGDDTESTFHDVFWSELDVVVNALDNVKARQYVDGRCIFFEKPLLESGTLGTKANTQVVIPRQTECYSEGVDPPEESIPMCTLRNFPHAIEHCIEWARDLFAGTFTNTLQEAASFAASPMEWLAKTAEEPNLPTRRAKLQGVLTAINSAKAATFATCVETARLLFDSNFTAQIKQLLHNFPVDAVDPTTQVKFWSGPKRPPTAAEFTLDDPVHLSFLAHGTALLAANFGVALPPDYDAPATLQRVLSGIHVPEFVPKSVKIKANETDATEEGADDDRDAVASLTAQLTAVAGELSTASGSLTSRLVPAEFEKDDDTNHHIDFITAAANLRARNYKIKETTRFDVKLTAGRIIPAIATTTCMVTGLVCVEFYKLVAGAPVSAFRNSFVNLADNAYAMSEPVGPKRTKSTEYDPVALGPIKAIPEGFTRWDRIVVREGDLTPAGLVAWLAREMKLEVSAIMSGATVLYQPWLYRDHATTRANVPISKLAAAASASSAAARPVPGRTYTMVDVSATDEEGVDVIIPQLQIFYA